MSFQGDDASKQQAELSPAKRALLEKRLQGKVADAAGSQLPAITPEPDKLHEPFPLTDIQQAYWIGRSGAFELGNVSTHVYLELESDRLDLPRFELAWQRLIERHGMLRAVILPEGLQRVLEEVPVYRIEVLDLSGEEEARAQSELDAIRGRMSHQVLPSDRWPLFEVRASRLRGGRVRLHLSIDILICDGWSLQLALHELSLFYQDPEVKLPTLELTFRDYVLAEAKVGETELHKRSKQYWQARLPDLPAAPELPISADAESLARPRFVRRSGRLERGEWLRLKSRATRLGLTPANVLATAFAEVLAAWSKSQRFTLNLTLFNRLPLHPQVNEIVGDFTTLNLLAVEFSHAESFTARALRLNRQLWQDLSHRYYGGMQVMRDLTRMQGGSSNVTMPVVFTSLINIDISGQSNSMLSALGEVVYSISQTPQVWLDHQVLEQGGSLLFNWDAVEDLFPPLLLDEMFSAYLLLLSRLSADDAAWHSREQSLLPAAQVEERAASNDTGDAFPDGLLHAPFRERASLEPGRVAVIAPDRSLSYGELATLSRRLGRRLRRMGAGPGRLVAVVMERGWEQVAGVLGVLESGAGYLPIEAGVPAARLAELLEDGQVEMALTQSGVAGRVTWPEGVRRLAVDELADDDDTDDAEGEDADEAGGVATGSDLAYVIYTSGSTGRPKGVMVEHRAALNTVLDVNSRFHVSADDRLLGLSSLGFDLSVYDIFGSLAAGAALVLPEPEAGRDPGRWLALMREQGVSVWNSVPALMQMLVEHARGRGERLPESLRAALLSGDWVPVRLPAEVRELSEGKVEVVSLGGATEASIWSILHHTGEGADGGEGSGLSDGQEWHSVPYGRAMRGQRWHVLNSRMEPCPTWVPGELYISGAGLARGYWGDPERTAQQFVTHPTSGERLYRTGDWGRWRPGGVIEFLGREDNQVKVQGYRIELGEVEAALRGCEGVKEAAAAAVGGREGSKRLVAFVVTDRGSDEEAVGAVGETVGTVGEEARALLDDLLPGDGSAHGSLLLDPVARLEFKLARHGLRPSRDGESVVEFDRPEEGGDWLEAYARRRSYRRYEPGAVALSDLARLLGCLMRVELDGTGLLKARYGSAGWLYPVQTYVYAGEGGVEGLAAGAYYYDPAGHRLVAVGEGAGFGRGAHLPVNRAAFDSSAFSLFLVGELSAVEPMYGARARQFVTLEAGLMTQLLEEEAPGVGVGLCQIGGVDEGAVRSLLGLGESQMLAHSLVGGRVAARRATLAGMREEASEAEAAGGAAGEAGASREGRAAARLRAELGRRLPEYMVPAEFVMLDEMPLTPNGKVDRKALSSLELDPERLRSVKYVAPRTPLEERLAGIWAEALGVERVGVHDNFFELGGDSLLAVRTATRVNETFQIDLPLHDFITSQTVEGVARLITETLRKQIEALTDEEVEALMATSDETPPSDEDETSP